MNVLIILAIMVAVTTIVLLFGVLLFGKEERTENPNSLVSHTGTEETALREDCLFCHFMDVDDYM
jgi:hypothetical protein